jgi:hypothetical protein
MTARAISRIIVRAFALVIDRQRRGSARSLLGNAYDAAGIAQILRQYCSSQPISQSSALHCTNLALQPLLSKRRTALKSP